jgi:hypothetical protein
MIDRPARLAWETERRGDVPGARFRCAARANRWLGWITLGVLALILATHAGLIGIGHWNGDEYITVATLRDYGWPAIRQRLLWSPRPASEPLYILYCRAAAAAMRPLIAPFLALFWALWLGAAASGLRGAGPDHRLWRAVAILGLLDAWLLCDLPREIFYWPAGTAAYLLALTLVTLLLLRVSRPTAPDSARYTTILLVVLACSCEVGAVFALIFAALAMMAETAAEGMRWRSAWPVAIASAGGVMLVTLFNRGRHEDAPLPVLPGLERHDLARSLLLSLREAALEIAAHPAPKLLFFLAMLILLRATMPATRSRLAMVFIASCLLSILAMILSTYYQFAALCCERQASFRQMLVYAALMVAATLVPWLSAALARRLLPVALVVLLAALVLMAPDRLARLWVSYENYGAFLHAQKITWRSGLDKSSGRVIWQGGPDSGLLPGGAGVPTGDFGRDSPDWWVQGILRMFHKDRVTIRDWPPPG